MLEIVADEIRTSDVFDIQWNREQDPQRALFTVAASTGNSAIPYFIELHKPGHREQILVLQDGSRYRLDSGDFIKVSICRPNLQEPVAVDFRFGVERDSRRIRAFWKQRGWIRPFD